MTTATCFERETRTLTTLYLFEEAVITYACSKKTSFLKKQMIAEFFLRKKGSVGGVTFSKRDYSEKRKLLFKA